MKRGISLLLVLLSLVGVFSLFASASGAYDTLYLVKLPADNEKFIVRPVEGYSVRVAAGQPFEFYVEPKEGYSLKAAFVSIDDSVFYDAESLDEYFSDENSARRYFRIESVTADAEVFVTNVNTVETSNMFAFFIKLFNQFIEFLQNLFGGAAV